MPHTVLNQTVFFIRAVSVTFKLKPQNSEETYELFTLCRSAIQPEH